MWDSSGGAHLVGRHEHEHARVLRLHQPLGGLHALAGALLEEKLALVEEHHAADALHRLVEVGEELRGLARLDDGAHGHLKVRPVELRRDGLGEARLADAAGPEEQHAQGLPLAGLLQHALPQHLLGRGAASERVAPQDTPRDWDLEERVMAMFAPLSGRL